VGRGLRARGRRLEGRGQVGDLGGQFEGWRLVIEAVVRVGRVGLFRRGCYAWVARGAGRGRGLGADDGRRPVDLAEVRERDLRIAGQQP
jgi:hypothetical protein